MNVELTKDDIANAVRAIVDEEMPDAVRISVLKYADTVIKDAVAARIGPVVDEMLNSEQFVTGRYDDHRTSLDQLVRGAVRSYLDQRVYLYSATDDRPSVRLKESSSNSGSPTRLEAFLRFTVERFCDEHLTEKLAPIVSSFVSERGGIEQVAREQMAKLLSQKFNL